MNYIQITKNDVANGEGIRVVLWTAGCSHHCDECHNPQTWNPNAGIQFTKESMDELLTALKRPYIKGITFSGGDPLFKKNLDKILEIINEIKKECPEKDIWIYSGYTIENIFKNKIDKDNIKRQNIILNCDVFVDGRYNKSQRNITLNWRGSENQRVIDIKKTIKQKKIVLYSN